MTGSKCEYCGSINSTEFYADIGYTREGTLSFCGKEYKVYLACVEAEHGLVESYRDLSGNIHYSPVVKHKFTLIEK